WWKPPSVSVAIPSVRDVFASASMLSNALLVISPRPPMPATPAIPVASPPSRPTTPTIELPNRENIPPALPSPLLSGPVFAETIVLIWPMTATSFRFPLLAFHDLIVHPSPLVHLRLNLPRIAPRSHPRNETIRLHLPLRPQVDVRRRDDSRLQPVVAPRLLLVDLLPLLKLPGVNLTLTLPDAAVRDSPSQKEPEAAARTVCQFFARSSAARFDMPFKSRISSNSRSSAAPLFFARASASFSSN